MSGLDFSERELVLWQGVTMPSDDLSIEDQVISFLTRSIAPDKKLTMSTKITRDLYIDGAEAIFLMEEFCKEFSIDESSLELTKYSHCEGIFSYIVNLPRYLRNRKFSNKSKEMAVSDLVEAARNKRFCN